MSFDSRSDIHPLMVSRGDGAHLDEGDVHHDGGPQFERPDSISEVIDADFWISGFRPLDSRTSRIAVKGSATNSRMSEVIARGLRASSASEDVAGEVT